MCRAGDGDAGVGFTVLQGSCAVGGGLLAGAAHGPRVPGWQGWGRRMWVQYPSGLVASCCGPNRSISRAQSKIRSTGASGALVCPPCGRHLWILVHRPRAPLLCLGGVSSHRAALYLMAHPGCPWSGPGVPPVPRALREQTSMVEAGWASLGGPVPGIVPDPALPMQAHSTPKSWQPGTEIPRGVTLGCRSHRDASLGAGFCSQLLTAGLGG